MRDLSSNLEVQTQRANVAQETTQEQLMERFLDLDLKINQSRTAVLVKLVSVMNSAGSLNNKLTDSNWGCRSVFESSITVWARWKRQSGI